MVAVSTTVTVASTARPSVTSTVVILAVGAAYARSGDGGPRQASRRGRTSWRRGPDRGAEQGQAGEDQGYVDELHHVRSATYAARRRTISAVLARG